MPRLSVVVATRNRATLVGRAVRSVLAQTMDDLEIVVVDDASEDATAEAIVDAAAGDPRVRYERLDVRSGPAGSRNRGLACATGEYVAFCDDDDEWLPTKASVQIDFLERRPKLGGVSCYGEILDEDHDRTFVHRGPLRYSRRALLWANLPGGCSYVLLRRSALPEDGPFDTELPSCVDWDLWLRVAERRPIETCPEVLCRYRFHAEGQITLSPAYRRGHQRMLIKYGPEMSSACRAYHVARLETRAASGRLAKLRAAVHLAWTSPRETLAVIAGESVSGRAARLRGDPARSLRSLVRRLESFE